MPTVLSGAQVSPSGQQGPLAPSLAKAVIGDTAQGMNPSDAIIVPRFVSHPDQIFKGVASALDDHFEGTTLDTKWLLYQPAGISYPERSVAASKLHLGGWSSSYDGVSWWNYVYAIIPNHNSFTITVRADMVLQARNVGGSYAAFMLRLAEATEYYGIQCSISSSYGSVAGLGVTLQEFSAGYNFPQVAVTFPYSVPKYLQIRYDSTTYDAGIYYSYDGVKFMYHYSAAGATSGFAAGYEPYYFYIMTKFVNAGQGIAHVDWVKFTNP